MPALSVSNLEARLAPIRSDETLEMDPYWVGEEEGGAVDHGRREECYFRL